MRTFNSYADMLEEGRRYRSELETWMADHGPRSKKPRPEHSIANKQRRMEWLEKTMEIFERGAVREHDNSN